MKLRKYIPAFMLLLGAAPYVSAQNSPYVEALTMIVNNNGFKSTSLRTTPISRPVPIHLPSDPANLVVSKRFQVAAVDYNSGLLQNPLVTWATACGWTTAANSSNATGVIATPATGCNNYSELGAPAGTWRVPTQRELMEMYLVRKEFGILGGVVAILVDGTRYWSSTTNAAGMAMAMDFSTGTISNYAKTTTYRVRCVRDL